MNQKSFEVFAFGMVEVNGVIEGLMEGMHHLNLLSGIEGSREQNLAEQSGIHMLGA